MKAWQVDYYISRLENSFQTYTLGENSRALLLRLFELTSQIKACGDDDRKEFWIKAERGSFEEYAADYHESCDEPGDVTPDEDIRREFEEEYPDDEKWYLFHSVNFATRGEAFYAVWLGHRYILSIGDCNERGLIEVEEFIEWLIDRTKDVLERLRDGSYNRDVTANLPLKYRYGKIRRKAFWDIYPELKKRFREGLTEDEIAEFVSLAESPPVKMIPKMTARLFYEACGVCYKAVGYEERESWRFIDTDEEHERYGGMTPKEMYFLYADGRDDNLRAVPLDDAEAFEQWKCEKGPYYQMNGHHPCEIRTSGFGLSSIHLQPYENRDGKGWQFILSGSYDVCSVEVVKYYLALLYAGYPVELYDIETIANRFTETDYIEIWPENVSSFMASDAVQLSDGDKPDVVAKAAEWTPEVEVLLETKENQTT
jgi:hypothetical protein